MPTIPVKDIIYGAVIVAIIVGGLWYHHKLIGEGIAKQQAADDAATATLVAETAKKTAELQIRATTAEQAYDKELQDSQAYRDSFKQRPIRLCVDSHGSNPFVPKTGAANGGNANPGPGASKLPDLPPGDSSSGNGTAGPDISQMLLLLAGRGDQVSAELREYQARGR